MKPELVLQWLTVLTEATTVYEQENMPQIFKKSFENLWEKKHAQSCLCFYIFGFALQCSVINFVLFGSFFRGGSFFNLYFLFNLQIDIESMRQC